MHDDNEGMEAREEKEQEQNLEKIDEKNDEE